jgi:two-component system response regulator
MSDKPIVLVEDNPNDEELTVRALRRSGIANEIVVARDGQEALDVLLGTESRQPVTPAVVLLDLKLPKIDGLEVLRLLRAQEATKLLPVVILTSSDQDRDLLAGYRNGCNSYVVKPVDFDQFHDAIRNVGLFWVLTNTSVG